MRWIKSLQDLREHIFSRKENLSNRKIKVDKADKPRVIYNSTCQQIADNVSDKFKYFPSLHKLKLQNPGQFELFIHFKSSRYNSAKEYVELTSQFVIRSIKMKKFAKQKPVLNYWTDIIIAFDYGFFINPEKGKILWNLSSKKEKEKAIEVITKISQNDLISFYNKYSDPDYLIEEIENENFELNGLIATVQFLLAYDKISIAENYLSRKLELYIDDYLDFENIDERFRANKIDDTYPHGHYNFAEQIAILKNVYSLKITVPNNGSSQITGS
jgi:hypothetical protein